MVTDDGGSKPRRTDYVVPQALTGLPPDLTVAGLWTILTAGGSLLPLVSETPIRVALGLPFLLVVPGYVTVAALFPMAGEGPVAESSSKTGQGIDWIERIGLSLGLSVAISPLIVLLLNFTPWGINLVPILVGVGGYNLGVTAVAVERRRELSPDKRFRVPYRSWLRAVKAELTEPETQVDAAINVLLVVSILLATATVGYAFAVPRDGERFSELYVLTESTDGELVPDDYPSEFTANQAKPIIVGVGNQEHKQTTYTVVIQIQDLAFLGPNESRVSVRRQTELDRFQMTLDHDESRNRTVQLRPSMVGERLRILFSLYRGEAPAEPSMDEAYTTNHIWVNVTG